mmetsp:Transcript_996/g.1360  ORF Transcript_996/g.1360 Transcript_996/m.1360 type:complete len:154 (+) Transcript_996:547-1008(+)
MSCGQVLMRKLRELSTMTVSTYTNLSQIIIYIAIALIFKMNLTVYEAFDALDWVTMASIGILHVGAQTLFFVAFANLPAPAVQPLNFMGLIFQFFIDLIFFDTIPNAWQVSGIALVMVVSAVQTIAIFRAEKQAKIEAEKAEGQDSEIKEKQP